MHVWQKNNVGVNNGFTLIEMLVYVALLILISTAAVASLISMTGSFQQQKAEQLVTRNATLVLERLLSDVRTATNVDLPGSTLEVSPGELSLIHGATTTEYMLVGDELHVVTNGIASPLTDSAISVNSLQFFQYDNARTEFLRVAVTFSATAGPITHTQTFNVGAVLRGSYE